VAIAFIYCLMLVLLIIIVMTMGGYYFILKIVARFKSIKHKTDPDFTPSVSLLIAAFNEASVLKDKLENSLSLDYPVEHLDIVVVSDGSTDKTNEIAEAFSSRGVRLIVNQQNEGKASAINIGMEHIASDIVVLTDANVMCEPDAIQKLVRNFADPEIGAVSGKVVLLNESLSYSDAENTYYSIEHSIQQLESDTGNVMGADGGMYALRQELFRPLQNDTLLDDLVLSMGAIQQQKRLIFDSEALAFEQNLAEIECEYARKVRIVAGGIQSRKRKSAWPSGSDALTTVKFICHKVLRWFVGPAMALFVMLLVLQGLVTGSNLLILGSLIMVLTYPCLLLLSRFFPSLPESRPMSLGKYLLVMFKASIVGCYQAFTSKRSIGWR